MNQETEQGVVVSGHFSRADERDLPAVQANPMSMLAVAVQRGMDPETIARLLALQKEWEANEARKAYNIAFAAFKSEAIVIIRNKPVIDGPLKGKSYAELFAFVDAVTPPLSKHGLSHSWKLTKDEKDWIEVTCTLKHSLGHFETVSMGGPPDIGGAKNAIQARASSVTYLEKYTLKAICGVAEKGDDNDGGGGKKEIEPDPEGKKTLEACGSMKAFAVAWNALSKEQRKTLHEVRLACEARIKEADKGAQNG